MDAWIDCLTYLHDGDGMSRFVLAEGESLVVAVAGVAALPSDIVDALVQCSAAVNLRYVEVGSDPPLQLLFR